MNLVRSHSAGNGKLLSVFPFCAVGSRSVTEPTSVSGVGKPLTPERSRMLLALRINVLAKGYSGISLETLQQVIEAFNGKKMLTESSHCLLLLCLCFLFSCSCMLRWLLSVCLKDGLDESSCGCCSFVLLTW